MNHFKHRQLADAAWDGNRWAIEALLADPEVDARAAHSAALLHAAHRGHVGCVLLLLAHSDPLARRSEALLRAAQRRKAGCVRVLAPVSAPSMWRTHEWLELTVPMQRLIERHHPGFRPAGGR
jgi:hypothetical protein